MPNDRDTQGRGRPGPPSARAALDAAGMKSDVLAADSAKIDAGAQQLAEAIQRAGLLTNQIRNFYGSIAKLQAESDPLRQRRHLAMLRSRLAYLTARADGKADDLWKVFDPLLKEAKTEQQVNAICDFAEAIVAYHKYYEWKNRRQRGGSHGRGD